MRLFDVYYHDVRKYAAVKQGFSWPAALFGIIWSVYKKQWSLFVYYIFLIILLVVTRLILCLEPDKLFFINTLIFLINIWIGCVANDWIRSEYKMRGYKKINSIRAKTLDDAIVQTAEIRDDAKNPENIT